MLKEGLKLCDLRIIVEAEIIEGEGIPFLLEFHNTVDQPLVYGDVFQDLQDKAFGRDRFHDIIKKEIGIDVDKCFAV